MDETAIAAAYRREAGPALASPIPLLGDLDTAEESLQDAFETALRQWPTRPPSHPRAWLIRAARNRAIDRLRRKANFQRKAAELGAEAALPPEPPAEPDELADDVLRLIFTCCHPALPMEARVALTLRTVCGLSTAETARS